MYNEKLVVISQKTFHSQEVIYGHYHRERCSSSMVYNFFVPDHETGTSM
jgi:hypothetical protein